MSDKQFLREFFSARQHQRLVRFFEAVRDFWAGWFK